MKRFVALIFTAILSIIFWCSCSEKEQEIPVASVTLSQPAAEMIIGESITLKATISPSNATEREIMWASSKQSVATVNQSGTVVAIAEGTSTITATAGGKIGSCVVTVSKGVVDVSSITLDKTSASLKVGETVSLTVTVKPDDATDKTVTWSTSDESLATVDNGVVTAIKVGSATITAKAGYKEATCIVIIEDGKINGFEYVDLGLPSGLKWATCDLGANKPEENGDTYAWGETEMSSESKAYKFYAEEIGSDSNGFEYDYKGYTKYITKSGADKYGFKGFYDNKTTLDMEDDVAHIKIGGTWRIPSSQEFEELRNTNNCLWEYVKYNGVDGYKVTSKKAGYTDKWIFFSVGGGWWSSSLDTYWQDFAYGFAFNSSFHYLTPIQRHVGERIRAVSK